jgi:hypothetical protein
MFCLMLGTILTESCSGGIVSRTGERGSLGLTGTIEAFASTAPVDFTCMNKTSAMQSTNPKRSTKFDPLPGMWELWIHHLRWICPAASIFAFSEKSRIRGRLDNCWVSKIFAELQCLAFPHD